MYDAKLAEIIVAEPYEVGLLKSDQEHVRTCHDIRRFNGSLTIEH
jgi:hypothetical protein